MTASSISLDYVSPTGVVEDFGLSPGDEEALFVPIHNLNAVERGEYHDPPIDCFCDDADYVTGWCFRHMLIQTCDHPHSA